VHRLLRTTIALMGLLWPAVCLGAAPLPRSVLILDATEPNAPWGIEFRAVLRSALSADAMASIAIYSEVLDLARFNSNEYKELLSNFLRAKYRDRPIGVIVVHGPQALEILMQLRVELWPAVPVVFGAVDEATVGRLTLPPDVTGTVLQLRLSNMVTAARALVPSLKQIALVGDPYERQPFRRHYTQELSQLAKEFKIIDLMGLPMGELKGRVAALPADTVIFFVPLYVDRTGTVYVSRDALGQVSEAANRPIVSDVETHIGYGTTGGFVAVPKPVALATARLAARILNGEDAANIPVTVGDAAKPVFDWRQLNRFGINEATLPPGSEVRFRELTAWDQYRWQIILIAAALLFQTTLIIGLFYEHRHRRIAEAASRGAMGRLAHMNRVATAGELSASIAHEVNQPLAAIVANANAGLRFLGGATPDLDEARAALESVVSDGHRAGEVVGNVRAMFKKDNNEKAALDLNDLVQDVLGLMRGELQMQGIIVQTELNRLLPLVLGHSGQLQQVVLNLFRNAAEAMNSVSGRARVLRVKSAIHDPDGVLVSVGDSGTGIDPKNIERIFESFYTTKSQGMGMGLSICRSIIEAHHGRLWASADIDHGAVFNVLLPAVRAGVG
jgi:signal transduction histidine kinase